MYAIIAMPRTASTSAFYWLNYSLGHTVAHPIVYFRRNWQYTTEDFRNMSNENVDILLKKKLETDPLPVVKLLAYSTYSIERLFLTPQYKKIVILPVDPKSAVMKTKIASRVDDWAGPTEERRARKENFVGLVNVEAANIRFHIRLYRTFLTEYAPRADFVFKDKDLIADPNKNFLAKLNLPALDGDELRGHYFPNPIPDRDMLSSPSNYDKTWATIWKEEGLGEYTIS